MKQRLFLVKREHSENTISNNSFNLTLTLVPKQTGPANLRNDIFYVGVCVIISRHHYIGHASDHQIRRIFLLMAHRVVSWSDNELCTSPVLSSAASIVSFDSTFSDTESDWKMSLTASEARLPSAGFEAKHADLPKFLEESTSRGRHTMPDKSFVRHDRYFFKDGNVTFLVCGLLSVCFAYPMY